MPPNNGCCSVSSVCELSVMTPDESGKTTVISTSEVGDTKKNVEEALPIPKRILFPTEEVYLGWKNTWLPGAGMQNMGNTCYLNSTLQALFHVPALANWLDMEGSHAKTCLQKESSCIICAMRAILMASQNSGGAAIRPWEVYSKLRLICRSLRPGRQEDAHEFQRCLVEAIKECYLNRLVNADKLDQYSKETTPLHQILGGYLRSTVKCLSCYHVSTTFQYFEDLIIDISAHNKLEQGLNAYFQPERLEGQIYKCEACNQKVSATKRFYVEQAPMVLCIALKRFSLDGVKLCKNVKFQTKVNLNKHLFNNIDQPQLTYKLVSMITHTGPCQEYGHYTAVGRAANGNYTREQ